MQMILKSVGDGGANNASDVALVQVMLMKAHQLTSVGISNTGYLNSYDGDCGNKTKTAIRAFQQAQQWKPGPAGGAPAAAASASAMKPGLIEPGDASWKALVDQIPGEFQNLRILPGGKIVFLEGTENERQAAVTAAFAETFAPAFLPKVASCINTMHSTYGVVISVCREGARRDFATQDRLLNNGQNVTHAGPGESNHNYGMAVDIGFSGLRWIHKNGSVEQKEDSWLHKLDPGQIINEHAKKFWDAMRAVGTSATVGLFHGPVGDRPHLQSWNDAGVNMGTRLADLLTRSGTMRWTAFYSGGHYHYRSDLGWGAPPLDAGTASDIWQGSATLTLATLKTARAAATSVPQGIPAAAALTEADVLAMKASLQQQFQLADTNWQTWTPN